MREGFHGPAHGSGSHMNTKGMMREGFGGYEVVKIETLADTLHR
jgi:hypothetical protein